MAAIVSAGLTQVAVAGVFNTPVRTVDLDPTATADWSGGVLRTNPAFSSYAPNNQPAAVIFTQTTEPGAGWSYGPATTPGPRYVRVGFSNVIEIGAVLTMGDSTLTLLATNAGYPGDLTNDNEWISGERLTTTVLNTNTPLLDSVTEFDTNAPALNEYSLWVFPPGTTTRALRLSHTAQASDATFLGTIYGIYVLSNRLANLAPQGEAIAGSNMVVTPAMNNSILDNVIWNNGGQTGSPPVSSANPQDILLIWPTNVTVDGLCALMAAFSGAEADYYAGPPEMGPLEAPESDWVTISNYTNLQYQVPRELTPNWLDFGTPITTSAIRLRVNEPLTPLSAYYNSCGGANIGLGEIFALSPLMNADLSSAILSSQAAWHPPIPVPFFLSAPGIVTLVIEDANGKRVRNLISETPYPAGTNIAWWDGLDESGKIDLGTAGSYQVQGNLVQPGTYYSRGLVRNPLNLNYQFSVGGAGSPPWQVAAGSSGGWLADHRPPRDVVFLPKTNEMLIGSEVAEVGDGLVWTDLNGNKLRGETALAPGGFYTASHLACDLGATSVPGIQAYAGYITGNNAYFFGISPSGGPITLPTITLTNASSASLSGLAVSNGVLFISIEPLNEVVAMNTFSNVFLATNSVSDPRGLAFTGGGQLLILSGNQLLSYPVNLIDGALGSPTTLVAGGLDDPQKLALDSAGNIYVSQWGNSHDVAVFTAQGVALNTIGTPGPPVAGPYDPTHMNNPDGLAIAGDGRLWVAEYNIAPKRISIWSTNGQLSQAFYGPPKYGGGGRLDPVDKTSFYYGDYDDDSTVPIPYYVGMQYKIDWSTGSNYLADVYYRAGTNDFHLPFAGPESAIYLGTNQYMANTYNAYPTAGAPVAGIWQMRGSVAVPVAAAGSTSAWPLLAQSQFASRLPKGGTLNNTIFVWSDLNDDGIAESNEVSFLIEPYGASFTVGDDLSLLDGASLNFTPSGFTPLGAPIYNPSNAVIIIPGVVPFSDGGGGQMIAATNGDYVLTGGPMEGYENGQLQWTYPSQWPDLYASQVAPLPSYPGELIGTTRLLGEPFTPDSGQAGEVWAVNGNLGDIYLMTVDGLFIATLFNDLRTASVWSMPAAIPGMSVTNVSLDEECFWPTITKTADGNIYLCAGKSHSSIVQLEGLESILRLPTNSFTLTSNQLASASEWLVQEEAQNISTVGRQTLQVGNFQTAPVIDGLLNEWSNNWVTVNGQIQAAVAVGQGNLYAAFQTGNTALLTNTGSPIDLIFSTGGGLDLMIGTTSTNANPDRTGPVAGDVRLVVAQVNGKTEAVLYSPIAPGVTSPIAFSSPVSTVYIDSVADVSASVTLAGTNGNYELAVPLAALGLNPLPGQTILGDIGVLIGSGGETVQRAYWQDKGTALVSDIPSEAQLTPELWGQWHFPNSIRMACSSCPSKSGAQFQFNVQADLGSSVVIEVATNLNSWTVVTNFTASSTNTLVSLPINAGASALFFRASETP